MSVLDEMKVGCPKCKRRKGKVCKGYEQWERWRDGPCHDERVALYNKRFPAKQTVKTD